MDCFDSSAICGRGWLSVCDLESNQARCYCRWLAKHNFPLFDFSPSVVPSIPRKTRLSEWSSVTYSSNGSPCLIPGAGSALVCVFCGGYHHCSVFSEVFSFVLAPWSQRNAMLFVYTVCSWMNHNQQTWTWTRGPALFSSSSQHWRFENTRCGSFSNSQGRIQAWVRLRVWPCGYKIKRFRDIQKKTLAHTHPWIITINSWLPLFHCAKTMCSPWPMFRVICGTVR